MKLTILRLILITVFSGSLAIAMPVFAQDSDEQPKSEEEKKAETEEEPDC